MENKSDRKFRSINSVLGKVLQNTGLDQSVLENRIFQEWERIVGSVIAKQCRPVKIEQETIYLETKNTVWRTELAKRQAELLNLLDKKLEYNHIKKIELV